MSQYFSGKKPTSQPPVVENYQLMSSAQKRFYASPQYNEAREELQSIVASGQYDTNSAYYRANPLSFIDRHLYYMSMRPALELSGYISNLKLMTRIRHD